MELIEKLNACRALPGATYKQAVKQAWLQGYKYLWFNNILYHVRENHSNDHQADPRS